MSALEEDRLRRVAGAVVRWSASHHFALPWRDHRNLYKTVVSEFMLQQTQVATVIPYFERWMAALPDIESAAAATEPQVLKLWEGLGYYRRVKYLHGLCRELCEMGSWPCSAGAWKSFLGVGDYMASAFAGIGQNQNVIAVDGNVVRILARVSGMSQTFSSKSLAVTQFKSLSRHLVISGQCRVINEGLMDIGRTICCARKAACGECPLIDCCNCAENLEKIAQIPKFMSKTHQSVEIYRGVFWENDGIWLQRRRTGRLHGIYEFPELSQASTDNALIFTGRRSIGAVTYCEKFFLCSLEGSKLDGNKFDKDWVWVDQNSFDDITLSGPHRKWLSHIIDQLRKE